MNDPEKKPRAAAPGPAANTYQRADVWGDEVARRWLAFEASLERALKPFGDDTLARACVRPGDRVIDVGCGTGSTSIALAETVGERGHVLGVDVAPALLERGRARARGSLSLEFVEADAQTISLPRDRDLIFSRFGTMFFRDAAAAFRNLANALRAGGRLAFVCWRPMEENPWQGLAFLALRKVVPHVPGLPLSGAGPYAFAEPRVVRAVLADAGLVDVAIDPIDHAACLGGDLAEAVRFAMNTGPTARGLGDADEATRLLVQAEITDVLAPHLGPAGVFLPAAAWVVTARSQSIS